MTNNKVELTISSHYNFLIVKDIMSSLIGTKSKKE